MKKIITFVCIYLLLVSQVFAKDLKFIQVTDVKYSKSSEQSTLTDLIEKVNNEKNIEFVVFTGDNISKPDKEELKNFLSEIKKFPI